jgi:4-hydroxy-3-methylbut-2-enyl diphosphate reductase
MKIKIAKTAGFCMGVRRAVDLVLDTANTSKEPIVTFGPLIHNPQVLDLLKEKGIPVIDTVPEKGSGSVLIRAHGVPPDVKSGLKEAGFHIIDATCPRVIKVQTIIRTHARKGFSSIIVGDRDHPEVIGLMGYAEGKGVVVESMADLYSLPRFDNAIVVAQTTQNTAFFQTVREYILKTYPHYQVFNTICDSTEKRQAEIKTISERADAVIVVGGKKSGNTQRLAEIAKESGKAAYHIETESELNLKDLKPYKTIAITAGASTPNWVINRVYRRLESSFITKDHEWLKKLFAVQRILLLTNLYLAFGAGMISYTCAKLQGLVAGPRHLMLSSLYILAMHIFNDLTGIKEDRYNDPDRATFYHDHMVILAGLAILAGALCLITAYTLDPLSFVTLTIMSILGLSYNFTLAPKWIYSGKYRRIRDIPGAKTLLITLAWGIVTTILPALSIKGAIHLSTLVAFLLSTGIVFSRTVLYNILDMQGDRIVGKETIPLLIGEEKTMKLIKTILIFLAILMMGSGMLHLVSGLGCALTLYPLYLTAIIFIHEQEYMLPGFKLEFLVETNFIVAGLMTLGWSLFYS